MRARASFSRILRQAPVAVPPLIWLVMGWQRRWITDDGLIAARTVRQLLAGNGPVFNSGERVEANTSTLWTYLLAAVTWITHANVYSVMVWTGLILSPLGLLFALLGARNLHRRTSPDRLYVPAGALVVCALPPFWDFATSGLEDSLVFCWLGLCWWLLTGLTRDSGRRAFWCSFVVGLGWLVRPDMAIGTVFFLAAIWYVLRPSWRRSTLLLLVAAALPVAYQIFRMGYYGLITPNTAVAKNASSTHIRQGLKYLVNYIAPYGLWVPLLLLLVLLPITLGRTKFARTDLAICAAPVLSGLLMCGYVVAIGGDFMHARMLLPATFTLLLPVMALPFPKLENVTVRTLAPASLCLVAIGAWALVCGVGLRETSTPSVIPASGIADERAFWVAWTGQRNPDVPQEYEVHLVGVSADSGSLAWQIDRDTASGKAIMIYQYQPDPNSAALKTASIELDTDAYTIEMPGEILGTLGAVLPLNGLVIDQHGLSYALGAHFTADPTGRVGHAKTAPLVWIIAEYSKVSAAPGIDPGQLAAARTALSCGALADLDASSQAPMTFGRFFGNVVHSYGLTKVQIPNDPYSAERKFCR
jgi:arabinofuranosyltransferase